MELSKEELPHVIVGAAMEVHKHLGPGLHAGAYRECLAFELRMREIIFKRDVPLKLDYKGHSVDGAGMIDFIVEDLMIIRVLAAEKIEPLEKVKLTNFLRLTGLESGFLMNFDVEKLRDGIKRMIVSKDAPTIPYS
jgi:GxxExxY protein